MHLGEAGREPETESGDEEMNDADNAKMFHLQGKVLP
jgi:hypothetical protein